MDIREKRKWDHIKETVEFGESEINYFNDVVLIPYSASSGSLPEIDLNITVFKKKLAAPLLINAMTGGAKGIEKYNDVFSRIAAQNNLAMAVGSQKAGLMNADLEYTFKIARKNNPDGLLFANLSALESVDSMKKAVDMIEADAIQLHVNHAQELSMSEGDRDFSLLLKNIEKAVKGTGVPVIIKEVGSGISGNAAKQFIDLGVEHFDVSGLGGTNFAAIEEKRSNASSSLLSEIGIPTPVSILEVKQANPAGYIFSSGGLKNSLDIVKSLVLGADIAAMTGSLLLTFESNGQEALEKRVQNIIEEIKKIFIVLGISHLKNISDAQYILKNEVKEWVQQRRINLQERS